MTDLIPVPHTGELIDPKSMSVGQIARLTDEIRDVESRLRELKGELARVVTARMDAERSWTLTDGEWKVSAKSDALVSEWDVTELQSILSDLVAEGAITGEAAARAVQPRVEYKVVAAGVNALMKSPALAKRLAPARRLVAPTDRRLSIARIA